MPPPAARGWRKEKGKTVPDQLFMQGMLHEANGTEFFFGVAGGVL